MKRAYIVQVPLEESADRWYDLCRCEMGCEVAAIIESLLRAQVPPRTIKVLVLSVD